MLLDFLLYRGYSTMVIIKVKKIDPKSSIEIPEFAYETDACADVQANINTILGPGEFKMIPTGLKFEIPEGWEIQVRPRSGLAAKYGITVLNSPGSIDQQFRGECQIILINLGKKSFKINIGDRIAQLAVKKVYEVEFEEVREIDKTERGDKGFGSTGI